MDVTIKAKEAWHVALAGPTGGGKSNALALLLLQLVPLYTCYAVNPHWARVEEDGRDWTEIERRFAHAPFTETHEFDPFFAYILELVEQRKQQKRR